MTWDPLMRAAAVLWALVMLVAFLVGSSGVESPASGWFYAFGAVAFALLALARRAPWGAAAVLLAAGAIGLVTLLIWYYVTGSKDVQGPTLLLLWFATPAAALAVISWLRGRRPAP
jgi:Flp pilus assembly protein protease CpaA